MRWGPGKGETGGRRGRGVPGLCSHRGLCGVQRRSRGSCGHGPGSTEGRCGSGRPAQSPSWHWKGRATLRSAEGCLFWPSLLLLLLSSLSSSHTAFSSASLTSLPRPSHTTSLPWPGPPLTLSSGPGCIEGGEKEGAPDGPPPDGLSSLLLLAASTALVLGSGSRPLPSPLGLSLPCLPRVLGGRQELPSFPLTSSCWFSIIGWQAVLREKSLQAL